VVETYSTDSKLIEGTEGKLSGGLTQLAAKKAKKKTPDILCKRMRRINFVAEWFFIPN